MKHRAVMVFCEEAPGVLFFFKLITMSIVSLITSKKQKPQNQGFTPNDISLYEKNQVLYETTKIVQELQNMSPLINKYGQLSVLQMSLQVAINNEYNPQVQRHVMGKLHEIKKVKIDKEDPFIYDCADMIQHQQVIF